MIGSIDINIRPLRLAFLVDPTNGDSIREAIQLNSTLWGGSYNPIIPIYKRAPRAWRDQFGRAPKADVVTVGYLDAFDPDILVDCGIQPPAYVTARALKIVRSTEIWQHYRTDRPECAPQYGIGVFEMLNRVFEEYFRYKAKFPVRVVLPQISGKYGLFWSALLGDYPSDIRQGVITQFQEALELETIEAAPSTVTTLLQRNILFPRRITQMDLEVRGRSGFGRDDVLFYMDATRTDDIIDYWNLRAVGKQVLPVPNQFGDDQEFRTLAADLVNRAHWPYKHNPSIWNFATFLKSRHVTMDELQAYAKNLDLKEASPSAEPLLSLQHWYPRIWDEWARGRDGAEPANVYGEERRFDIPETKERIQFQTFLPKAAFKHSGYGEPRCANDVSFRVYGSDELMAEVFPQSGGENLRRAVSPVASLPGSCRIGKSGLVRLVEHDGWTEHWDIPRAQEIFFAWLRDTGWNVELSSPGLIAKELLKQMEGFPRIFANEGLLRFLEHMNGGPAGERELTVGEVKNRLSQMADRSRLYDYLIQRGAFRIGAKIQCPNCRRHSWFSLENIEEELDCPRCLRRFSALGNVDQGTWCYKTAGPFSVSGYADGAYCVLLALETLGQHRLNIALTPSLSFKGTDSAGTTIEADFGALWKDTKFGETLHGALFGECKTFGKFEKKDFERMEAIAKKFSGSILAFCTLRKSLEKDEVRAITRIAKAGRKHWKSDRPINPVLILTGNEILSIFGPPSCWRDMGLSQRFEHAYGLLDVCDASQQIYLKLPSWRQTWHERRERKRTRRANRMQRFTPGPPEAPPGPPVGANPTQEV